MAGEALTFELAADEERLFIAEAVEQIERIEAGLLDIERGGRTAADLNEIFRAAHTLKGSAATIGHARMADLTHAMEDVFGAVRTGAIGDVAPFADTLLATIDVLRSLVDEVAARQALTDAPAVLTAELRTLLGAAQRGGRRGASRPEPDVGHDAEAVRTAGRAASRKRAALVDARRPSQSRSTDHGLQMHTNATAAGDTRTSATDPLVARVLGDAGDGDGPRSIVRVAVDPASEWGPVRLVQVTVEAQEDGRLIAQAPTVPEIEVGLADTHVVFLVVGRPAELAGLVAKLEAVDEVAHVSVDPVPSAGDRISAPTRAFSAKRSPKVAPPAEATRRAERRQADLGEESRGLSLGDRHAVAGDRLRQAQQTIRIDVSRLDELMNIVGELIVQKTRLQLQASQLLARLGDDPLARLADEGAQQFARIAAQLQDHVTGLRMLPIESVFNRFPRVVRDVAAKLGKDVELVIDGRETELDRSVLDEVGDPLGHLVRNALDHGIEPPADRIAAGKPAGGIVRLSARHADGSIVIDIEDDGRGIDPQLLRERAVAKGLISPEAAASMPDADALSLIFAPGFSTARHVTDVSGRGVGMDVVRTNIERLGGQVEVESTVGVGTKISLSLPLTLAIVGCMLVRSTGRVCALPLTGVVETLRVEAGQIRRVRSRPVITVRDRVLPVVALDAALDGGRSGLTRTSRGFVNMVVVRSRELELALAVDEFVGQQEIVLKSMSAFTGPLTGISGATILADGSVGLVVDIPALIDAAGQTARAA